MNAWLFTAIIFVPVYIGVNWLFNRYWPDGKDWPWHRDRRRR